MLELAALRLDRSRIPHLALSLAAKRAGTSGRPATRQSKLLVAATGFQARWSSYRYGGNSASYIARRHASTTRLPSRPPTQLKPTPTFAQREAAKSWLEKNARGEKRRDRMSLSQNGYFWICSIFGFLLSTYLTFLYVTYRRSLKEYENVDLPQNSDVSSRWMDLSRDFDAEVELSEKFMGLRKRRERLCREARGNVLEVSAGTGRNMELYKLDPKETTVKTRIKKLVFNDLSEGMLFQAEKKFEKMQERVKEEERRFAGDVEFVVGDAGDRHRIKRPEGGFDTIVQTMGICSETNPVLFLKRLGELARQPGEKSTGLSEDIIRREAHHFLSDMEKGTSSDYGADETVEETERKTEFIRQAQGDLGGQILLLEHGRSNRGFLNQILDNGAKKHADTYGCWYNKDIEQIVRDSGLFVESRARYHLGTTYEYVLRPATRAKPVVQVDASPSQPAAVAQDQQKKQGWSSWFSNS